MSDVLYIFTSSARYTYSKLLDTEQGASFSASCVVGQKHKEMVLAEKNSNKRDGMWPSYAGVYIHMNSVRSLMFISYLEWSRLGVQSKLPWRCTLVRSEPVS